MKIYNFVKNNDLQSKKNKTERKNILNRAVQMIRTCRGFWQKDAEKYAKYNKSKNASNCKNGIFGTIRLVQMLKTGLKKRHKVQYKLVNREFKDNARATVEDCVKSNKKGKKNSGTGKARKNTKGKKDKHDKDHKDHKNGHHGHGEGHTGSFPQNPFENGSGHSGGQSGGKHGSGGHH